MKLLLAVDIGNSETKLGLFRGNHLLSRATSRADDPSRQLRNLTAASREKIAAVALASAVQTKQEAWESYSREELGLEPFLISGATPAPLAVRYHPLKSLGSDRLAAAVAAAELVGAPAIVAHLGTATVVDAVSAEREFLGGAISAGVALAAEALAESTDRLPRVRVKPTSAPLGSNTADCIRAGALYGAAGQVELLARRMRELIGARAKLVLTGGWAELVSPLLEAKHLLRLQLTLEGIQLIWRYNDGDRTRARERPG